MSNGGQNNSVNNGDLYATQSGDIHVNHGAPPARRGPRTDTKVLFGTLLADAGYFLYGVKAYTGNNTTADMWRSCTFLLLFLVTCALLGRWVRRRI
ncbi:hypothetical protein ACQEVZ_24930 [Dactylosporangium sp. CA-152071]|uniref:hypothetical protein n=1 Tax=Dactylosporangium sp. CA-152071 TaxID=3239933 RepID=UPI003D9305B4